MIQPVVESQNSPGQLTPRDLRKVDLSVIGATISLPFFRRINTLFNLPSTDLEIKIMDRLNLSPDQLQVTFKTGSHVLTAFTMDEIGKEKATIISGELRTSDLGLELEADPAELAKRPDTRDACLKPGIGVSPQESADNAAYLQTLVAQGLDIATLDVEPDVLLDLIHPPAGNTIDKMIKGASLVAGIAAAYLVVTESRKMKKAKFDFKNIKQLGELFVYLGGAGAAAFLYKKSLADQKNCENITSDSADTIDKLGRNLKAEQLELKELSAEKFFDLFRNTPVMGYEEGLVPVRNLGMAYNLWRLMALSVGKNQTGVKIFSHQANEHGEIEDLILQGPEKLQDQLMPYIKRIGSLSDFLISKTISGAAEEYDSLLKLTDSTFNTLYDAIGELTRYTVFFQEVNKAGKSPLLTLSQPTEVPGQLIPPSARTLIFREMIDRLKQYDSTNDDLYTEAGFLKTALMVALAYTSNNESKLNQTSNKLTGQFEEEKIIGTLDFEKQNALWFDQYMAINVSPKQYLIDGKQLVGCLEVNGRICPIVRDYRTQDDKIISQDRLIFGPNEQIIGSSEHIYEKTRPAKLPDHTSAMSLKVYFGHPNPANLDFYYTDNYPTDKAYWLQGKDPAKIRLLTVK